jgi:Rod binding domain-containing protein
MNLENGINSKPDLLPLDLSRNGQNALKPLDMGTRPKFDFKPLDLHKGDATPMQQATSLKDLNAPNTREHLDARKQAEIFVSQAFFGTMLKQMRDSPFKSEIFDGGRGGQAFGSLYDQHLAERMAKGAGTKLVNSIVRKLEAKKAYEKTLSGSKLNANSLNSGKTGTNAPAR